MTYQPPAQAVENGHSLDWDPPAAITAVDRWTCRECSATALRYRLVEYGDATEVRCPQAA
ncbi:hypothetical protein [Streptomyces sp. NPDC058667]|uniref:hypothetical protein n=1 Tax=Streptomyces sp. NPDC058667 TaxID=3346588 RepID=UPI00364947D1